MKRSFAIHFWCGAIAMLSTMFSASGEVIRVDFDTTYQNYSSRVEAKDALALTEQFDNQFVPGVSGRALDLSSNVPKRRPIRVENNTISFDEKSSFFVSCWVRTEPNAPQGTPIFANGYNGQDGWKLLSTEKGTWKAEFKLGEWVQEYAPPKQVINDGLWHMLAFAVDREQELLRFYYDGRCVAIYNNPGMGSLAAEGRVPTIGGYDESFWGGDCGMIEAFNGYLDEIQIGDMVPTDEAIRSEFNRLQPNRAVDVPKLLNNTVRVMEWNIFHGGRHPGRYIGPLRVAEMIRAVNPDVVAVIETYGSGAILGDELGYQLYLISNNLSILSRFPVEKPIKVYKPFNAGGAIIAFDETRKLAFCPVWLDYRPDVLLQISKKELKAEEFPAGEKDTRLMEINEILSGIQSYTEQSQAVPVIVTGDFNVGSHLDWGAENAAMHDNMVIEWPVSKRLEEAGFIDTYRMLHPDVAKAPALSWCVWDTVPDGRYQDYTMHDRIDFIYLKGEGVKPFFADYIERHETLFPSDHGTFYLDFEFLKK